MIYDPRAMKPWQALDIYRDGGTLDCPVCGCQLITIPEHVQPGKRPRGLVCPRSDSHVMFYGENAEAVRSIRSLIKKMGKEQT